MPAFKYVLPVAVFLLTSCTQPSQSLSAADRAEVRDSVTAVARRMVEASNRLDFTAVFATYSPDSDARFVENGELYPSLDAMKATYAALAPSLESLENQADHFDVIVLDSAAGIVTAPIHVRVKAKGRPAYDGRYVLSALIQRRHGAWLAVQTHESWVNPEALLAAITPAPPHTQ